VCVGGTTDGPPNLLYTIKEEGWSAEQGRACINKGSKQTLNRDKTTGNAKYTQAGREKKKKTQLTERGGEVSEMRHIDR
jgi:hypothetical protein